MSLEETRLLTFEDARQIVADSEHVRIRMFDGRDLLLRVADEGREDADHCVVRRIPVDGGDMPVGSGVIFVDRRTGEVSRHPYLDVADRLDSMTPVRVRT